MYIDRLTARIEGDLATKNLQYVAPRTKTHSVKIEREQRDFSHMSEMPMPIVSDRAASRECARRGGRRDTCGH